MTPGQTALVLAKAQAYDRRTVGEADVLAWHQAVGDLPFEDALAAVTRHYRDTTDWLMPSHIRRLVIEIGRGRRRAVREAREQAERLAIEADPTRRDRSEDVRRLVAEVRDQLPDVDPVVLRRREVVEWERQRERATRPDAAPNSLYDPTQPIPAPMPGELGGAP